MSEQNFYLIKNQNLNFRSLQHELCMQSFGLWCTTCRPTRHMAQFCTMTIRPQVPPYKPLHHMNQTMNSPQNNT